jgi:fructokinase
VQLIYFGSLIQRTPRGALQLKNLLTQRRPRTQCLCDINLRPPHYSSATIATCLEQADFLKLNEDELVTVGNLIGMSQDPPALALEILDRYNIALLAITRGAAGSTLITTQSRFDLPAPPALDVIDTVGAGDGYAAVLALGLLSNWPLEKTAEAAGAFAARMCALPGAVPDDPRVYEALQQALRGFR